MKQIDLRSTGDTLGSQTNPDEPVITAPDLHDPHGNPPIVALSLANPRRTRVA